MSEDGSTQSAELYSFFLWSTLMLCMYLYVVEKFSMKLLKSVKEKTQR